MKQVKTLLLVVAIIVLGMNTAQSQGNTYVSEASTLIVANEDSAPIRVVKASENIADKVNLSLKT